MHMHSVYLSEGRLGEAGDCYTPILAVVVGSSVKFCCVADVPNSRNVKLDPGP